MCNAMFALKTARRDLCAPPQRTEHLTDAFMKVVKANGVLTTRSRWPKANRDDPGIDEDVVVATGGGRW
jgi:hypothetical protein